MMNLIVIYTLILGMQQQPTSCQQPPKQPISVESYEASHEPKEQTTSLGTFKLSAYCACEKCCGVGATGHTATGTKVKANQTIAVDPKVIPLGSTVLINGNAYIAEDTGGAIKGKRIDIYFESHQEALNFGRQTCEVYTSGDER